jgi:hypothetical protein
LRACWDVLSSHFLATDKHGLTLIKAKSAAAI